MSIRTMSAVWESDITDRGELLVLLALADFSNDAGECWPAVASIARKARMDERSVRRILRKLEAAGWLTSDIGGGRHGCSRYTINPDKSPPGQNVPPDKMNRKPGQNEQKTRTLASPEPSKNRKEPSVIPAREAQEVLQALSQVLSPDVAQAFIDHRKAKRAKLTPHAARLIARKLAGHPDPDAVAEASIANGWTGVFPESQGGASDTGKGRGQKAKGQTHGRTSTADFLSAFLSGAEGSKEVDRGPDCHPPSALLARR